MEVLMVLLVSFVLLRGVGWLGVERLASWRNAGLGALAIMFLFTSTAHFSGMKYDLAAMMPEPLPDGLWVIHLTGVFEISGAIGLLIPRTRRLAGICLALLLLAMFPANVYAALGEIPLGGYAPTPLWLRTPMQIFFIGMVWWTSIKERPKEAARLPAREPVVERANREGTAS
ncbi:MAG: DoxX family protein [Rubrobacteraceae bacterium]